MLRGLQQLPDPICPASSLQACSSSVCQPPYIKPMTTTGGQQAVPDQLVQLWTQLPGRPPALDEPEVGDHVRKRDTLLVGAVAFGANDRGEHHLIGDRLEPPQLAIARRFGLRTGGDFPIGACPDRAVPFARGRLLLSRSCCLSPLCGIALAPSLGRHRGAGRDHPHAIPAARTARRCETISGPSRPVPRCLAPGR